MEESDDIYQRVKAQVDNFNKKGVPVTPDTRFQQDLEWDLLTLIDLVACLEEDFVIFITMN
jgi:acyl carrier protein